MIESSRACLETGERTVVYPTDTILSKKTGGVPMSEFMMQTYVEISNWIESLKREEGQTLAEYALLLALIAIVVIGALLLVGPKISTIFTNIAAKLVAT
jgi:pilus assembly protein Flp/PilA